MRAAVRMDRYTHSHTIDGSFYTGAQLRRIWGGSSAYLGLCLLAEVGAGAETE
jgi:hypothetical protein